MTPELFERLRVALAGEAPRSIAAGRVPAAVLVPLFAVDRELHLLYTTRNEALPHHGGQVAFPGGRHVAGADASLLATALREAQEEIGLNPSDVDVLGALDPIHTLSSNFGVTPFVAVIPHPYAFRADPREVSEIFSVPLRVLADPATAAEEAWTFGGRAVPIATYRYEGHVIWGATQRITATLLDLLTALHVA